MSSPLHQRLNRLERQRGLAPGQCPVCGLRPKQLKVVFADEEIPESEMHCSNCGRSLVYTVEFDSPLRGEN